MTMLGINNREGKKYNSGMLWLDVAASFQVLRYTFEIGIGSELCNELFDWLIILKSCQTGFTRAWLFVVKYNLFSYFGKTD